MKFWHLAVRNCETCLNPLIPVHPGQTRHPNPRCDPDPADHEPVTVQAWDALQATTTERNTRRDRERAAYEPLT